MNARETAKMLAAKPSLAGRHENKYTIAGLEDCDPAVFDLYVEWNYAFSTWCQQHIGFEPVALVESGDWSESYEMDRLHIFECANGSFAEVDEVGCSCYEYDWATVDFHSSREAALEAFNAKKRRMETGR